MSFKHKSALLILAFIQTLFGIGCNVFAQQSQQTQIQQPVNQILPVNIPVLHKIAVVEAAPKSNFLSTKTKPGETPWSPQRWQLLTVRKNHPDVFDKPLAAIEKKVDGENGSPALVAQGRFVNDFIDKCYPKSMQKPWEARKLTKLERTEAIQKFLMSHKNEFAQYDIKLPIRIGTIIETELKTYDKTRQAFPVRLRQRSAFQNSSGTYLQYRSKQAVEQLSEIPVALEKAQAFLSGLENRRIHILDSHNLVSFENHPSQKANTTAVLEGQAMAVFAPGKYDQALYVKRVKPISELGQSEKKQDAATSSDANADGKAMVIQKMQKLCQEMNLFNINGVPVINRLPSSILNSAQTASTRKAQQALADRILLHEHPQILDPNQEMQGFNKPELFTRLLGPNIMAGYLDGQLSRWQGADEFQIRKNRDRFFANHSASLRKLALGPPFRFRTLREAHISKYDFDKQSFPIDFDSSASKGVRVNFDGMDQKYLLKNFTVSAAFKYPKSWKVDVATAEKISNKLGGGNQRHRKVFESTVFDVYSLSKNTTSKKRATATGSNHQVSVVDVKIYKDKFCSEPIWKIPLFVPPKSRLESTLAGKPHRDSKLYLWQAETQVALLDKFQPDKVTQDDWVAAALGVYQDDMEYFKSGQMLPHRIRGSERNNLISQYVNSAASKANFWKSDFRPFFPQGYFNSDRDLFRNAAEIPDEHVAKFRDWMRARLSEPSAELRVISQVNINRESGRAELLTGETTSRGPRFSLENINDYGMVRQLFWFREISIAGDTT